ncbi:hypothetical protein BTA51_19630 [Hahella sp. CCB-MM4]|nr:hypothetical protein BTA51_19630 [Hahella sp. CCB-MM4]
MMLSAVQRFLFGMALFFGILLVSSLINADLSPENPEKQMFNIIVIATLFILSVSFGGGYWWLRKRRKHAANVNDIPWHQLNGD